MACLKAIFWHLAAFPLTALMHALNAMDAVAKDPDARAIAMVLLVLFVVFGVFFMRWIGGW